MADVPGEQPAEQKSEENGSPGQATARERWSRWVEQALDLAARARPAAHRVWQRLVPLLRKLQEAAEADTSAPPPDEVFEHRELSEPILVSAKGHAFTFTVRALLTWSARGQRPEAVLWCARNFLPKAIQQVRRVATDCAREIPPHRAADLEVTLQAALDRQDRAQWRFTRANITVECRPEVWVRHDERVQQVLRPYWDRLIELEYQFELYLRRAVYAEWLNRRWAGILDAMPDGLARGAEAETIREELARARRHVAAEQRAAAQWCAELLRDRRLFRRDFESFSAGDTIPQQPAGPPRDATHRTAQPPGGAAGTTGPASEPTRGTRPRPPAQPARPSAEPAPPSAGNAPPAPPATEQGPAGGGPAEPGQDDRR